MVMRAFTRRRAVGVAALPFLAACGSRAQPSGDAGGTAALASTTPGAAGGVGGATAAPTMAPTAPTAVQGAAPEVAGVQSSSVLAFQVQPDQSTAVFRVREQLAGRDLPNDAVGTTGAVTGQLVLDPSGAVVGDAARITVDLRQLQTDSAQRDNFIKRNTLRTDRFPTAEFAPTRAEGLPSPLPESGEHRFTLIGLTTIHGVQREVSWDVAAARQGRQLTGTATTAVKFGDFGMEAPRVPVVLSVVDEIRLELNLVATLAT